MELLLFMLQDTAEASQAADSGIEAVVYSGLAHPSCFCTTGERHSLVKHMDVVRGLGPDIQRWHRKLYGLLMVRLLLW